MELLNGNSETCGLFAPNVQPGFLFGSRPAEIDVCSQSLRIAIEVDGYFHFTDSDRYRRDRRKDFVMQQRGYLVLRFLAEDIVPEMESVLETVLAAVRMHRCQRVT